MLNWKSKITLTFRTWFLHVSDVLLSQSEREILSPSWRPFEMASSKMASHLDHMGGRLIVGDCGGMNPVRVSTSKSCAASVVVSGTPWGTPTRASGLGRDRRWFASRCSMYWVCSENRLWEDLWQSEMTDKWAIVVKSCNNFIYCFRKYLWIGTGWQVNLNQVE